MGKITLLKPKIENKKISYVFSCSNDLKKFFSKTEFCIIYPEDISRVPLSVLIIPFVCNVLPIVWLTDSTLYLDEIDKSFFESIPEFKKGYIEMFLDADFKGKIIAERIIKNEYPDTGKSALFYSGGLDSAQTLISHLDEKPLLLSIWGSDIKYSNEKGWDLVHSAITEAAERFGLEEYVFRSTFREFDNEGLLDKAFSEKLGDGWWHGVKHSIGLLGHIAPFVYLHSINKMYIAASNCAKYGIRKCASTPNVDNFVKFCSCNVYHDGYEFSRQDKIHNIVCFSKKANDPFRLHVCWESQQGDNCCHCEKCYRTISELWVENANPDDYGFINTDKYIDDSRRFIYRNIRNSEGIQKYFPEIRQTALKNRKELKQSKYYNQMKWILKTDFEHPEIIKMPFSYRMRSELSKHAIYQQLHTLKSRIKDNK